MTHRIVTNPWKVSFDRSSSGSRSAVEYWNSEEGKAADLDYLPSIIFKLDGETLAKFLTSLRHDI